jgi:hypothetical protein
VEQPAPAINQKPVFSLKAENGFPESQLHLRAMQVFEI